MKVCLFAPDMAAFEQRRLRSIVPAPVDGTYTEILLTNSYGLPPEDGTHVNVTGGSRTLRMRTLRWLLRDPLRARVAGAGAMMLARASAEDLLEGLRAADADAIVSLDPAWTRHLRRIVHRRYPEWPCVDVGERWAERVRQWRRYDPGVLVTIVLPTYNGTKYLARSLASCLAQTHARLEVVVVDDGSGPEVARIVETHVDPRVRYLRHPVNRGLPAALNTGFAQASGELLTWTSDDNYYTPDAIEQMVRFLCTDADVDFVYADAWQIDPAGDVVGRLCVPPPEWLKVKNRVGGCFLYRRAVYEAVGDYDSRAVLAEDYDYWLRIARRFTMQRLFGALYYYRFHDHSLTGRSARERVRLQAERVRRANNPWWRSRQLGDPYEAELTNRRRLFSVGRRFDLQPNAPSVPGARVPAGPAGERPLRSADRR
jgi:GT2 family glycosyltransferase